MEKIWKNHGKIMEFQNENLVATLITAIAASRFAASWCDLDLTLDHAAVTMTFKILSGLYLRNHKVQYINNIYLGCWCATSWFDLYLTFDLAEVMLTFKILSGLISQKPYLAGIPGC